MVADGIEDSIDSIVLCQYTRNVTQEIAQNLPVYPIGVVAQILNLHPETLRVWERYGVVQPQRRSGRRFYSNNDLKRLRFVLKLTKEQLNKSAVSYYIKLYPCWKYDDCPPCMHRCEGDNCGKPCWKEEGVYCISSYSEDRCTNCEFKSR